MFVLRVWMLYAVMAGILFLCVDREQLGDDMLNACRPSANYVHSYSYGKDPFNREELERSLAYYETLLLTNPRFPFVHANMGFCYFYLGDPDRAVIAYRKSLPMASYMYTTYFDLGFIALSRGDNAEAAKFFEKSRSLVPRNRDSFLDILKILPKRRLDPSFQEDSSFFKRVSYDLRMIYVHLGKIYFQLKEYSRLASFSDEGIALFPNDPQMYYYAGLASFYLNDFKQAMLAFDQTIFLAPDYTDAYLYRSRIWQLVGDVARYQADTVKYKDLKKTGGWKRPHDILDLHHWHDVVLFSQMYNK